VILFGALFMPGKVRHADAQDVLGLWALLNRARTHSGYLLLVSGFFVCGFHVAFIATHLPAYVVDKGLSQSTGANALAMIGLFNVFGTLLFGWLADRLRKKLVLSSLYGLRAVVISGFLFFPVTETTALVFGALIGLIWLATVPITSGLVSQMFGSRYLGTLYGVVFLGHQCGAFLGAWWAGRMFDASGSYAAVWWTAVALGVVAALMHLLIRDHRVTLSGATATAA
jgi:predicted MFS family arabinose efflux permease